jgi:hypothetical protein
MSGLRFGASAQLRRREAMSVIEGNAGITLKGRNVAY